MFLQILIVLAIMIVFFVLCVACLMAGALTVLSALGMSVDDFARVLEKNKSGSKKGRARTSSPSVRRFKTGAFFFLSGVLMNQSYWGLAAPYRKPGITTRKFSRRIPQQPSIFEFH